MTLTQRMGAICLIVLLGLSIAYGPILWRGLTKPGNPFAVRLLAACLLALYVVGAVDLVRMVLP
jgi:hypothetical protein